MNINRSIVIEELIRTMALLGMVMYGVLPIAYLLNADIARVSIIAFPIALLSFPVTLAIRIRTGSDLKIHTKRGWYIFIFISFIPVLIISSLSLLTGYESLNQLVTRIFLAGLFVLVLALIGARTLKSK
ncbi:MAG: hypothetical protein R6U57_02120 [Anaerolineales bacterium]